MTSGLTASLTHDDVFLGDGEMATLMRAHDWSSTALGPVTTWSTSLKVAIRLLLTSRFEMWMGWGNEIAFFYNDAYRPTLGIKHPLALGRPTRQVWSEIWPDVEGRLHGVLERAEATWDRALLLLLNRSGYVEETYHTFSYSPLMGDSGAVEGVFCAVSEETERVISERRLASLSTLASGLAGVDNEPAIMRVLAATLDANLHDMPFSLTYLFDGRGAAQLPFMSGVEEGSELAAVAVANAEALWGLTRSWRDGQPVEVDLDLDVALPTGAWTLPPKRAAIVPLIGQGTETSLGVIVIGLNPYRKAAADYLSFLRLLAGQVASSLASARVCEAERVRARALAEAVQMREAAADALAQANRRLISEVALRTQERDRVHRLFRQAPSFMCLLQGPEHVFELVNDAYQQLIGHRDVVGLRVRDALPEIAGQGFFELLDKVYATGTAFVGSNLRVQLQREPVAPLEQRYLHLVYQPIFGEGAAVEGIFVDGYDVTHQHRAEDALKTLNETLEQRVALRTAELGEALAKLRHESDEREAAQAALRQAQRMESLGQLTGGVAHDFNNLLQVISGNLQLLRREVAGNERAEKRVQSAIGGVMRGAKLASQLLAFGRRQPLAPKVINIGRFIKGMDDMLRRALGEEIELETVISGGLWNALVDPGQIENAILNLAINARDAMNGGGRLTIEAGNAKLDSDYARVHSEVQQGQYVMIAVTDTGSGIAPELLERVFEPFFSTKAEGKGTGLGLSMVYGFVKQSGGHVKIYSELGHGTTIKLYLPRVFQDEDVLDDAAASPAVGGSETVLVVEDDDEVRETAVGLLTDLGYRVLKAREAVGAMSVIDSGLAIDLLFTDVVMPGPLRSPELARRARERLPSLAVLFTSGYTENAIVHGGRLDRGVELLSKPYTREALARKVRHVLGNQAQQDELAGTAETRSLAPSQSQSQSKAPSPSPGGPAAQATSASTLANASTTDAAAALEPQGESCRATVLLVEDDPFIRETLAELLGACGYRVLQAPDAASALAALDAQAVDVMVTDVGLPQVSGIELARQALARRPSLPVVFATGDPGGPARSGVLASAVLVKPFTPEALEQAVVAAISPARDHAAREAR